MASQSASISVGVFLANTSIKHGAAGAVITTGALSQASPYSGGSGVNKSPTGSLLRSKLPHSSVNFGQVQKDGSVRIDPVWYRFLDFVANVQLGGPNAPTVADLNTATISTRDQAISAQTSVAAVGNQVNANAQALGAVVQVAQTNSLSGATQIPPVSYTPPKTKGYQP